MTDHEEYEIRETLKQVFPPADTALRRDLWPLVLQKLEARTVHVPWYDWALIGLSASMLAAFPQLVLVFAYHL